MLFEKAVDAIVTGDSDTLGSMLAINPELVLERSAREHHATLLHYLGANGVEEERQASPRNAVNIAKMLLDAGSEVDALADIYGRSTTLGLVSSSVHPRQAGGQIQLLETLLHYGADIDGRSSGSPLVAALRNGHAEAAEFLAQRGAALGLEGAAGVGRLDLVKGFFEPDGGLRNRATKEEMESGFLWACEYGHTEVIHFLLENGVNLQADGGTGLTGLHWAVVGAKLDAIDLLVSRGASITSLNRYGGTAFGQAVWSAMNGDPAIDYVPVVKRLLQAGATVDDPVLAWLSEQTDQAASSDTARRAHELTTAIRFGK